MASQIRIVPGGAWHRRKADGTLFTECGAPLPGAFFTREDSLEGSLCQLCHTRHEIDTGEMIKLEKDALADLRDYGDDDGDELTPTALGDFDDAD